METILTKEQRKANERWLLSKKQQASRVPSLLPWETYKDFHYPDWYNRKIRNGIRARDKLTCQYCRKKGTNRTLHVHHIDYNKTNCKEHNLITLCPSCHSFTNYNRLVWFKLFYTRMRG